MSEMIKLRVEEAEATRWRQQAEANGLNLSAWIKTQCGQKEDMTTPPPVTRPEPKAPKGLRKLLLRCVSGDVKFVDASTLCPRCLRIGALSCADCRARHP